MNREESQGTDVFMIGIYLLLLALISLVVFCSVYVKCPKCAEDKTSVIDCWVPRWRAFIERREDFYEDGWMTIQEHVDTDTNFYDTQHRFIGTGQSRSLQKRTVPSRTVHYTTFYSCPKCEYEWQKEHSSTFQL